MGLFFMHNILTLDRPQASALGWSDLILFGNFRNRTMDNGQYVKVKFLNWSCNNMENLKFVYFFITPPYSAWLAQALRSPLGMLSSTVI